MYDLAQSRSKEFAINTEDTVMKSKFQSLFQDQTVSWIRIVIGIDKFVREAMPIQVEEKASVKPAAKWRPVLKPSSTSGWDSTPMWQRQWIDIETQESKDPYRYQVSKFITRLLRHSKQGNREENGGVHILPEVISICEVTNAEHWRIAASTNILCRLMTSSYIHQ